MNKNEILIQLSESGATKVGKEEFGLQSLPQKIFSAVWEVESEVNNGGFAQYFFNDSAASAPFVVEALEKIGALQAADICRRAIAAAFPNGLPLTAEESRSAAEHFSPEIVKRLDALDPEFYSYPNNLADLLFMFVSNHPEEFGTLPRPD